MLGAVLGAHADLSWPPVLTFFVVGLLVVAAVAVAVIFRRLRAAARSEGRRFGEGRQR